MSSIVTGRRAPAEQRGGLLNDISRRRFLFRAGAVAGGTGVLAGCNDPPGPYSLERPDVPGADAWPASPDHWVMTTCGQCLEGCGVKVRVVNGRAVRIEGNPDCPVNEGAIGPKGQVGTQLLYHPDRVTQPLRRDGPRGSGKWKPISWEIAVAEIAEKLSAIRQDDPAQLVVCDGQPRGSMPQLWDRFLSVFGSPNHIRHHGENLGGAREAVEAMQGVPELPAYDVQNASYILVFGDHLLESSCRMMHAVQQATTRPRQRGQAPCKLVQVSSNHSLSASRADNWVAVTPGTEGALALALAHVLVKEKRYNAKFVEEHTSGFEAWEDEKGKHAGFQDVLLADYAPERMSAITGVAPDRIARLARDLAAHKPAVVVNQVRATTCGLGTALAIHAINALLGNLEQPGGVSVNQSVPLTEWPAATLDQIATSGSQKARLDGSHSADCPLGEDLVHRLPDAILGGQPYRTQALFLYYSNPAFSKPAGQNWQKAISQVPLVVSFSPLPDESTFWADYVLPDHTYLERWELVEPAPHGGRTVLGIRQPVVSPRHDTLATGDFLIRLAKAIGAPLAEAFPWESCREAQSALLEGLLQVEGATPQAKSVPQLIGKMEAIGGWWGPETTPDPKRLAFPTKSGKFEFFSHRLADRLKSVFPDDGQLTKFLNGQSVGTRGDALCMPHWEPAQFAGSEAEYPFILQAYRAVDYTEGGSRQFSYLRELPTSTHGGGWKQSFEIHPEDARRLSLFDGDEIWVESPVGKRHAAVTLMDTIQPGTIGLHLGSGVWPPELDETSCLGLGGGLLADRSDPLSGLLAFTATRVRIRK